MKKNKFLWIMILVVGITSQAFAGLNERYILFDNETSIGAGEKEIVKEAYKDWGCDVTAFGNPSSIIIRIEGNQEGNTYDPTGMAIKTFDAAEIAAKFASFVMVGQRVKQIRGNIVTLSGGTAPAVTVKCTGGD